MAPEADVLMGAVPRRSSLTSPRRCVVNM